MLSRILKLTAFVLIFFISNANSQTQQWLSVYQGIVGNSYDIAYSIALDPLSGNSYVTGMSGLTYATADYATLGYDANGNELWTQHASRYHSASGHSQANWIDLQQTTYDKIYVTGWSQSSGYKQYATIAYWTSNGGIVWTQNPVAVYSSPYGDSYGAMVKSDVYDNVYVTGYSAGYGSGYDYVTVMYDANGTQQWATRYNGTGNGNDYAYALSQIGGGGWVYVTGMSRNSSGTDDLVTVAYDGNGVQQWVSPYGGASQIQEKHQVVVADRRGVYVTGVSNGNVVVIKYDPYTGQQLWDRAAYQGVGQSLGIFRKSCGTLLGSPCYTNDVYAVGYINNKYGIIKYDDDGNFQWEREYGTTGQSRSLGFDNNENVYVTGNVGSSSIYTATVKWDKNGNQLWDVIQGANPSDGKSIAVNYNGYAYITGCQSGDNLDYKTILYTAPPGNGHLTVQNPNGTENQISNIPDSYSLAQNYPNPFNPVTVIKYGIPKAASLSISVYNLLGQKVATLVNETKDAGYYDVRFDGSNLSSGIYIYRIVAGSYTDMKKMVLMK
jgi:hypothetical protein